MEKKCEFCMALRPIVYCKADAAHLCLSCDAKVHSANALSFRHPRTLVCESCRRQPAVVRCYDHQTFMCQSCDTSHHAPFQHQKRVVSCFVGCPSARELAALWGFELDELEGCYRTGKDQGAESSVSKMSSMRSEVNSASDLSAAKAVKGNQRQQNSNLILQQIVELERIQLSEGIDGSCSLHVKDQTIGLPFRHETPLKLQKTQSRHIESSVGLLDFEQTNSPLEDKNEDPLSSSPFSQINHLTGSGNALHGDWFWQCKSPAHNNEVWLQNMQDLGVCNEVLCFDDVKIPDVDLTFCNFEELFRTEHEPIGATRLLDDENMACSFEDKLDRSCEITMEQSRVTGESSLSECKDDEISTSLPNKELHYDNSDNTKLENKENVTMRYKEKKHIRHERQGQYTSPKSKCGGKKRRNSDVSKVEDDCARVTRSF